MFKKTNKESSMKKLLIKSSNHRELEREKWQHVLTSTFTLSNFMDTTLQSGLMKSRTFFAKSSICCVCFFYENLSKCEGFRPW